MTDPSAIPTNVESLLGLVGNIYDTVLEPSRWVDILGELGETVGGKGAGIWLIDDHHHEANMQATSWSIMGSEAMAEYQQTCMQYENFDPMLQTPARTVVSQVDFFPDEEAYRSHPPIRWIREHLGMYHTAGARLSEKNAWLDAVTVQFDITRGPITPAESRLLGVLIPHLARAIELHRPFSVLRRRYEAVLAALDRFQIAVFILTDQGRVAVKNKEALRILDSGKGLQEDVNGRLRATLSASNALLQKAITEAIATARATQSTDVSVVKIANREGTSALLAEISPFRDTGVELDRDFRGSLVFVIDPDHRRDISTKGMAELYRLTEAESEICRLVANGMNTPEMAETRGVAPETIRSQVKSVLQKTHSGSRLDLVRLALTINLPIDNDGR